VVGLIHYCMGVILRCRLFSGIGSGGEEGWEVRRAAIWFAIATFDALVCLAEPEMMNGVLALSAAGCIFFAVEALERREP